MAAPPPHQSHTHGVPWILSHSGNVFYRTEGRAADDAAATAGFPSPLIGPRRTRPHAIHIVTYPPGYVPRELRPSQSLTARANKKAAKLGLRGEDTAKANRDKDRANKSRDKPKHLHKANGAKDAHADADRSSRVRRSLQTPVLGKLLASFSAPRSPLSPFPPPSRSLTPSPSPSPSSSSAEARQLNRRSCPPAFFEPPATAIPPPPAPNHASSETRVQQLRRPQPHQQRHSLLAFADDDDTTMATTPRRSPPASAYQLGSNRNSIMSVRSTKSTASSLVTPVPKPVATGSGVACSILLAEPNVFLSGFDHDDAGPRGGSGHGGTALLRGKLQLNVSKNVKIRALQLKLLGRARTEWPEGIPPLKQDVVEEESLRTQVLTFFNATNDGWETDYGNQCAYRLRDAPGSASSSTTNLSLSALPRPAGGLSTRGLGSASGLGPGRSVLTAKELKRLSLQSAKSRSFGKGDNDANKARCPSKGFKVFYPGTYEYSFELPIDHHQLETTKLQYGSVRWELQATVDRAGTFKPNLHGTREVSIVRLPDQMSLEMTEPISIGRQWDDQLHYDIVISGKSFPIGSRIPIAFKLTPLAKVQVHKLRVYVTESIEYWTSDRRVTRKEPGRKILLLEKSAGKPLDAAWASSDITTVRGGEPSAEQRRDARDVAERRRNVEATRARRSPEPLPEPTANLLGDLDLGLESMWGSTEMEANVQIPTCEMMAKNKDLRLHPDCSWKNVNVYHWIKIVMRISRLDPDDVTGTKRRHFEISIDSPFTVLNCRATQANTSLPAYSGLSSQPAPYQSACGCPDAVVTAAANASPNSSTGTLLESDVAGEALPVLPQAAHLLGPFATPALAVAEPTSPGRASVDARPIHLLRAPSFNPPAFDADVAPPPAIVVGHPSGAMLTPPPQYDAVVGTPSVDGLADYFARLADYGYRDGGGGVGGGDDEFDSGSDSEEPGILGRSGRVNVSNPRTPGGRLPSRSMELSRPPVSLDVASLPRRSNRSNRAATTSGGAL